jgi:hypothetical protein
MKATSQAKSNDQNTDIKVTPQRFDSLRITATVERQGV